MKKVLLTVGMGAALAFGAMADSASFPGGETALKEYLATNMKYPQMAKDNGIEGTVDVAFTVKADGSIGGIKIVRMVDPDLEQEAIRLVKNMPAWTPATDGGAAISSPQTLSIPFVLE